jgi:hypothetical protein
VEEREFRPNPLIEKLTSRGDGAVRLLGYIGSTTDGLVKVYPSLDDLSFYYEIHGVDILHVEDAPAEVLPHGGSEIWVRPNARVESCKTVRQSAEARFLAGEIADHMTGGPAATFRARTAYQFEPETVADPACQKGTIWPCSQLWGWCLATSVPCGPTQQQWCQVISAQSCGYTCGYTCNLACRTWNCPHTFGCLPTRLPQCQIGSSG